MHRDYYSYPKLVGYDDDGYPVWVHENDEELPGEGDMMEYIIRWNIGYGDNFLVVEAQSEEDAENQAYEAWRDDVESSADYEVIGKATEELKDQYL